ncbi:glycoside hydrolase family 127 protein [candidate division KSB1 bacterium]|nr:glycoside hydrolase family 127 protein [candidate division KSB1 bacterium]
MIKSLLLLTALVLIISCGNKTSKDYPIQPVPFTDVKLNDNFWAPRLETNRTVTVPYDFKKCEETGRLDNFAKAGGLMEGEFVGIRYNDSDVFKIIEGASYSLSLFPDPELEKYLDDLIFKIAAAQEDDGYLYTTRTINPDKPARAAGDTRWSFLNHSHELYNVGHMYEAAVAFYQATGKRSLLDVAIKSADLIDSVFGPEKRQDIPGHQEIEIGLAKLYRVTGEEKYLKLAKFFLDERGRPHDRELYNEYVQDHKPVIEQFEAVGHAVRAGYMYSGIADIAALTGDKDYINAINQIWENVVSKKLYITGGIGARHKGEAFGDNYELPNLTAYNETCAAIANMMWNHRLFLLHGEAKYMDVFERTLYNGFLSGVGMSGNEFFYPNPLESTGDHKRKPWFDCSCCPSNVVRFLPSLPGYVYAAKDNDVFINLFINGKGEINLSDNTVQLTQTTNYPWDGSVKISVEPKKQSQFTIKIRIPGWAQDKPVPSDLYRYLNKTGEKVSLKINLKDQPIVLNDGFAEIRRSWQNGDVFELNLPMQIRKVLAHQNIKENAGKFSLERGPIVYCAEGIDNGGKALNLVLQKDAELKAEKREYLLNGVFVLTGSAITQTESKTKKQQDFTAIPYYGWAHRGQGEMKVWFPYE